jgi:hypothetical protein
MKKPIRIIILEDDTQVVKLLLDKIQELEFKVVKAGKDLSVIVLEEAEFVEKFINPEEWSQEDIVLLYRDDIKGNASFHSLNFDKFNKDNIISISSIEDWNKEAKEEGLNKVVLKDFKNLDLFAEKVSKEIKQIVGIGN